MKYDSAVTITTSSPTTTPTTSNTTTTNSTTTATNNSTNTTNTTTSSSSSSAVVVHDISTEPEVEISTLKNMTSATQQHRNQYTITDINIYNKIIEYGIQKLIVYTTDISILSQMIVSVANMIKRYRCLTTTSTTSTHAATPTTIITPITSITPGDPNATTTTTTSSSSGIDMPDAVHTALAATANNADAPVVAVDVNGSITATIVHICIKALFQSTGVAVTLPLPPHFNTTLITTTETDSSSSTALTTTTTTADNGNSSSNNNNNNSSSNNNSNSNTNSSSGSSSSNNGGSKVLLANLLQSQEEYSKGKIYTICYTQQAIHIT